MFNNRRLSIISILAIVLALVLGGVAVVTAIRLSTQPSVSPTVPQVTPRAAAPDTTPACTVSFSVGAPSGPVCNSLISSPSNAKILASGETRLLTASASGGFGAMTYTYSISNTGGAANGVLTQSNTGSSVATWVVPDLSGVTTTQTWTISTKAKDSLGRESTVGNCSIIFTYVPISALKCDSVSLVPNNTVIVGGSETRRLTATASGGIAPLTYSWVSTSGSFSSTTGQSVTWTAPGTISSSDTWRITATVRDSAGSTDSSGCVVNLTSNPPVNPSCNSTCQSSADCPNDLACISGRCRNAACVDSADCKCPPPPKVCNDTCTVNSECPGGMVCAGGNCRNASCITQSTCACPPPVTPPTTTATHRECRSNACVTVNGAGADTCSSDVSCRPAAVAPKIPESGVELPTILGIVGGAGLLLLGVLFVL